MKRTADEMMDQGWEDEQMGGKDEQHVNKDGDIELTMEQQVLSTLYATETTISPATHLTDITDVTRGILIDWLCSVCDEYQMNAFTYFLAIQLVDRYLALKPVVRADLQLLGKPFSPSTCGTFSAGKKLNQKITLTICP
jgi:hypothetical protein